MRNLVLINNDTYQRETVSERPIRQPLRWLNPVWSYRYRKDQSHTAIKDCRQRLNMCQGPPPYSKPRPGAAAKTANIMATPSLIIFRTMLIYAVYIQTIDISRKRAKRSRLFFAKISDCRLKVGFTLMESNFRFLRYRSLNSSITVLYAMAFGKNTQLWSL